MELGTYQGAFTISRKTLDWIRSKISMFEFEVVLQSWMPCPDEFEYRFVDEEFVVGRVVGLASE
jgi:hypothetical protein